MQQRVLKNTLRSIATSDGAGVKLRRSLGAAPGLRLDPFLMLDEFGTDRPEDYIAGFPPHPHRGFQTVTYMLDGHMRHEDHMGNVGELTEGGVQWMNAGRGVIHSEMPQQKEGRMRGFQLWINLPAAEKMSPADYRDIPAKDIPVVADGSATVKVIAGAYLTDQREIRGPVNGISTEPVFLDVTLPAEQDWETVLPAGHNALVYVYEGGLSVQGPDAGGESLPVQSAGFLSDGDYLAVTARNTDASFLVLAAKPIGEPVVQRGPFVMNTREEIEQAIRDYTDGTLVAA